MEKYSMVLDTETIKFGTYKDLIYEQQANEYGDVSAEKNLKCAINILRHAIVQCSDQTKRNNTLLVGKVQSGKTSNLEMLSALCFDNGFNLLIIYGGYDKSLLKQCYDRFSSSFAQDEDKYAHVFDTNMDLSFLDDDFVRVAKEEGRPIIICSLKRPKALSDVNSVLDKLNIDEVKTFIIDDEGDQASLNTHKKNFDDESSSTYQSIVAMKSLLHNPIYFAVTATPEANIFQPEISELMPASIHLIKPASCYTGADEFHLGGSHVVTMKEDDVQSLDTNVLADSLKKAIHYYIIASALLNNYNINTSEMIIHSFREIAAHDQLIDIIERHITDIEDIFKNGIVEDIEFLYSELESVYTKEYFGEKIINEFPWNTHLKNLIKNVIRKKIKLVKQNSEGNLDERVLKSFKYKIFVGGDLLQRGLTFKHLICTYFTRWSDNGNIDTNLQRARWFGYRQNYIDLCKVFATKKIKEEFTHLADIENGLWSQFEMVENNQMKLSDIIVDASETSLNPTRKNVSEYKKIKFASLWTNQQFISLDTNQVSKNNNLFEKMIEPYRESRMPSTVGRKDGVSTYYLNIPAAAFKKFVKNSEFIFDQNPFNSKTVLCASLENFDSVCIQLMFGDDLKSERHRSFSSNKISFLQQGPDTSDLDKQKYQGDAKVIANTSMVCVQVFNVVPDDENGKSLEPLKQYMYSIHFPTASSAFAKN